ncbi:MAG: PilZ domain-containing protein [Deltaproteobacteria bacterium]|nr:PilZ domain-containing protein [Deltaproteobacteria bacterium]
MQVSTLHAKERFDVNLDALYGIKGQGMKHQECHLANLSSGGAKVYFSQTESLKSGAVLAIDIPIPNTAMCITVWAEIMWIKPRCNEFISGIKFTCALSDAMVQKFVKRVPQLNDYTELIW